MAIWKDLLGTVQTVFKIGTKAAIDSSAVTVNQTFTLPNLSGTIALTSQFLQREIELDFGTIPINAKTFTFADASVSTISKIIMVPSAKAGVSNYTDELELTQLVCAAYCATNGTVTAMISANSLVVGSFKYNYLMG